MPSLQWLAKLLGLPTCFLSGGPTLGGGTIQGTASETIHAMMVAAADAYLRAAVPLAYDPATPQQEAEDLLVSRRGRLVALASTSAHAATAKAAHILGLRFRPIRVTAETDHALTGPAVLAAVAAVRAAGLEPFFLTTTLGTTDCCAVDDFAGIAAALGQGLHPEDDTAPTTATYKSASNSPPLWLHIDAAYAGAALVCPEVQAQVNAPAFAAYDSFNVNMHKWLLTNNDCSCAYVRDRRPLVHAFRETSDFAMYRNAFSATGLVTDYRDWGVALGRRFRALKVWFVLRSYGRAGLQAYIRRGVALAERLAGKIREGRIAELLEVVAGPRFALVLVRVKDGKDEVERDARTRRLCELVNASGRLWATGTNLDGHSALRLMTGNRLTGEAEVDRAVDLLLELAEGLVSELQGDT
jgi:aromatic-L-amino-acid/L-tryptophan decarboxylase